MHPIIRNALIGGGSGGGGAPAFSPIDLFQSSEQGVWYDPSDFSTMFQDSAGTTPVTATGQPIGKILDKSGNGNHASQATSASRPLLKQDGNGKYYAEFDGVDDGWTVPTLNLTSTNKLTATYGAKATNYGILCEHSVSTATNSGAFVLLPEATAERPDAQFSGATGYGFARLTSGQLTTKSTYTCVVTIDLSGTTVLGCVPYRSINGNAGLVWGVSGVIAGGGNFANYPFYIGSRGGATIRFAGRMYGLIIRGANSSVPELVDSEAWINSKTGAY